MLRGAAAQSVDDVGEIEELHASFPFSREQWDNFMKEYWQKRPVVIRGALEPGEASMPIDSANWLVWRASPNSASHPQERI